MQSSPISNNIENRKSINTSSINPREERVSTRNVRMTVNKNVNESKEIVGNDDEEEYYDL